MFQRRPVVAAAVLLCFAIAARAEVPVAGSLAKPPAKPASDNPCLKYLPDDAFFIGNVDIKTILAWLGGDKDPSMLSLVARQYAMTAQILAGIDFETEVDFATVFISGNPEKDPSFLIVINGSFTTNASEKKLADNFPDAEIARIAGKNLYTLPRGAFAFPEGGTLAIGTPDLVKAAIGKARAKVEPPKQLAATLAQTDADTALWLAVKPKVILENKLLADFAKENPDLVARLNTLDFVSLAATPVADGLRVSATAALADKETAKTVADFLAAKKSALLTTEGVNTFYLPILLASEIETGDLHVRTNLRLTKSALKELWETKVVLKK